MVDYSSSDDDSFEELRRKATLQVISNNNYFLTLFQDERRLYQGAVHGHNVINHDRETAHRNLYNDYFSENPLFSEAIFRRRFRMGRSLFLRVFFSVKQGRTYSVARGIPGYP